MPTAAEHNLKKASNHTEKALTRLRTIQLDDADSLTSFQRDMIEAYKTHLADIKESIDEMHKDLEERHEKMSAA